jgi:hypothetical protein
MPILIAIATAIVVAIVIPIYSLMDKLARCQIAQRLRQGVSEAAGTDVIARASESWVLRYLPFFRRYFSIISPLREPR